MNRKDMETIVMGKLEEIRQTLYNEFGDIGKINVVISYDYVSAFSTNSLEGRRNDHDFINASAGYKANGEKRW